MSTAAIPSGPRGHLLTGNLPEFRRDPLGFFAGLARDFGEVAHFRLGRQPALLLSNPDYIEQVLVQRNRDFSKSRGLQANRPLLGNGLLTNEGESWRRQRQLLQPAFHRERIAAYGETMTSLAEETLARWSDGQMVDIHQEMMRLTLEIAGQTLFGSDVAAEAEEVRDALQTLADNFRRRTILATMLPTWFPAPSTRRMLAAIAKLDRIVYGIIDRRRRSGEERGDLLSILLRAQYEDGTRMTDKQLRDEVMTLFLAGHETTAIALSWTFYLLALNPEAETRLAAELEEVLGVGAPSVADYPRLKYAEAVISESMRVFPPAWVIGRQAIRDVEIGPERVGRGAAVFMSQWVMHQDSQYFPEPEKFRPERWLSEAAKELPKFAYFPFGGGPRHCIGHSFAMLEATLLLSALAREFHMEIVPGQQIVPRPAITLRPAYGIRVVLRRRAARQQAAA